jgi:hypothetical protein
MCAETEKEKKTELNDSPKEHRKTDCDNWVYFMDTPNKPSKLRFGILIKQCLNCYHYEKTKEEKKWN